MQRHVVSAVVATALVVLGSGAGLAAPAHAGGGCPPIKGSPNPSDPSHVLELYWDIHGCQVPLRQGVGHIPWEPGDFGYQHIASRYAEGKRNHETTAAAKILWQQALLRAGAVKGEDYLCHYQRYTAPGGRRRTMMVLLDYKRFEGFAYKGITTAYWVSGHRTC